MHLLSQRPNALEVFLLAIFLTSTLSASLAVYRDIQRHDQYYRAVASSPKDDSFSISGGTPISRGKLPMRLVLMASLLLAFIGVRLRKFGGRLFSALTLLLLIAIYVQWWRHWFNLMRNLEHSESAIEIPQTVYLIYGNWLDIGVFLASVWALGWVVVTLITHSRGSRVVPQ